MHNRIEIKPKNNLFEYFIHEQKPIKNIPKSKSSIIKAEFPNKQICIQKNVYIPNKKIANINRELNLVIMLEKVVKKPIFFFNGV